MFIISSVHSTIERYQNSVWLALDITVRFMNLYLKLVKRGMKLFCQHKPCALHKTWSPEHSVGVSLKVDPWRHEARAELRWHHGRKWGRGRFVFQWVVSVQMHALSLSHEQTAPIDLQNGRWAGGEGAHKASNTYGDNRTKIAGFGLQYSYRYAHINVIKARQQ